MIRHYIAGGLMTGLVMLLGCCQVKYRMEVDLDFKKSHGEKAPQSPTMGEEVEAKPAHLSSLPPINRIAQPAAPETGVVSEIPEAVAVRVSACRQGTGVSGSSGTILTAAKNTVRPVVVADPAPVERAVPSSTPRVVRLEVTNPPASSVTRASYTAPVESKPVAPALQAPRPSSVAPVRPLLPASPPKTGYGHAADYSWLSGELEYLQTRQVWRLRYALADQEDRYGGTVILVGEGLPANCKAGQLVRVEGQLLNPDSDRPRPPYRVRTFQVMAAAPAKED